MKSIPLLARNAGMSLLEVTIAIALFAIVIGITATSLTSFYVSMDVQEQRIEAMHACRGVLDALREKRAEFVDLDLAGTSNFPLGLTAWIDARNTEGWPNFLRGAVVDEATGVPTGVVELDAHALTVLYTDIDGGTVDSTTNPLQIHVLSTWNDRHGRPMQVELTSLLSDR